MTTTLQTQPQRLIKSNSQPNTISISKYITQNKGVRSGEKCLKGTRLTLTDVISIFLCREEKDYHISEEQLDACLIEHLNSGGKIELTGTAAYDFVKKNINK